MALGNESSTRSDHVHMPNPLADSNIGPGRDDRVLKVSHRPASLVPNRLDADHRAVLHALATHLMPADDGASVQPDIVVRYIDYLVANEDEGAGGPLTLSAVYEEGCVLVQAHARHTFGRRVEQLTPAEQDQLVWDMLECSMDGFDRFSPAWFFNTLRRHIADAIESGPISPN